jgi:DDE family transposase
VLCVDAGLATVGVIAIDGTKVHANANRARTMDYEQIARAIIEEAIETDAAQTAALGDRRGDELPEIVGDAEGRQAWLRAARQRLDQQRARRPEPIARSRPKRLLDASADSRRNWPSSGAATTAIEAHRAGGLMKNGRRFGAPPKPYTPPAAPEGKVNVSDPDSRLVHGMRGWIQGYNAQAVCNEQHLILAAEVMTASPDFGHLGPMLTAARSELGGAGVTELPEVAVADAGYWHPEQINHITGHGIPVLIAPDSSRRKHTKDKRPGWNGGAYDFMRSVLDRARRPALHAARATHRAGLGQHQAQPRVHRVRQTRQKRRADRVAADGHPPQPAQAPQALHRAAGLSPAAPTPPAPDPAPSFKPLAAPTPDAVYATASPEAVA